MSSIHLLNDVSALAVKKSCMPAAQVMGLVSGHVHKTGGKCLCVPVFKREKSLNEWGAAACCLHLPSSQSTCSLCRPETR